MNPPRVFERLALIAARSSSVAFVRAPAGGRGAAGLRFFALGSLFRGFRLPFTRIGVVRRGVLRCRRVRRGPLARLRDPHPAMAPASASPYESDESLPALESSACRGWAYRRLWASNRPASSGFLRVAKKMTTKRTRTATAIRICVGFIGTWIGGSRPEGRRGRRGRTIGRCAPKNQRPKGMKRG